MDLSEKSYLSCIGSNEFQAISRSNATMSLAAHDLGYGKKFQHSRMSENLGTPSKLLWAGAGKKKIYLSLVEGSS
jgi:hypothetical protein